MEDSVFRMAVYLDRLDKGLGPEQAALDARRWFIDYDINAPLVQALKKTVLPFVSYTYRIAPLLAETAALRPHKFAKWSLYGYAVNEASQAITGEDDEVTRLTMRDSASRQMFGVPFLSSSTLRLPMNSAAGDPMFLDVSRWIPGGDIFEQKDTSTAIPLLPAPLQPGGIWYDVGYTLATKTDPFTGQPIKGILPDDGGIEKFGKLLANYLSKQAPNMPLIPGSYAENKRQKAIRAQNRGLDGELYARGSDYSEEYSPFEAVAYGMGIKLRPQNINIGEATKNLEYTKTIEELGKAMKQAERDYVNENIDAEERDEQVKDIEKSMIQISAEFEVWERKLREARDKEINKDRKKKFGGGEVDVESAIDKPEQRKSKYLNGEPFQTETLTESLTRRRFNRGNIVEEVREEPLEVDTGTVKPEYRGQDVYEQAISKLAENEDDAALLREYAFVESKFATDPKTFRKDNRSAYQITPIRFQDFTNALKPEADTGAGLRRYVDKVQDQHGIDLRSITYDDLNDPEIATAVTRALIKLIPGPIGKTPEERAVGWKNSWNSSLGAGSVARYLEDMPFLYKD
jgi:hypothetical protein